MNPEPFKLVNDPPAKPKPVYGDGGKESQRVLFTGLNCQPGQIDLFETEGESDEDRLD